MKAKILIVDDSRDIASLLEYRLKSLDYDVNTAETASLGMSMLQQDRYDVVISDVVMPGMNGVEFMNSISGMPGNFQVIFMSGAASEATADTLVRMGALGFLKKPLNFEKLESLIDKALGKAPSMSVEANNSGSSTETPIQQSRNRANVLIVDDMAVVADLLKTLLTVQGFNVSIAHDGEQGVEVFKREKIDLVVTDLVMPKMNGVELIKRLRQLDEKVPIMATTGEAMNLNIQDALNHGASMCIRKPFTNKLFVDKVETLYMQLQRSQTRLHVVEVETQQAQEEKVTVKEKIQRDPVKAVSMGALILLSFTVSVYLGSYVFLPPREDKSITDIDDRIDQMIEAIRMDWGR